jgi:hypothetical protein
VSTILHSAAPREYRAPGVWEEEEPMKSRRRARVLILVGGVLTLLLLAATPAAATITPHLGGCTGNGTFSPGGFKDAASASITIPAKSTVNWAGAVIKTVPADAPRTVTGKVRLELPLGSVTLGEWNTTGTDTGNSGFYDYDVPGLLAGFDVTFTGEHYEPEGLWCSGKVKIQVEGSNPLAVPAIGLTVISIVGVSLSIRPKSTPGMDLTEYRKGDVI